MTDIDRIAVLGAGTMGHGIALAAMSGGFDTTLYDVSTEALARARGRIDAILAREVERGRLSAHDAATTLNRLRTADHLGAALRGTPFVIEAVPERMSLKLEVLGEVERFVPAEAVIATNTSALSITELAAALSRAGRLGGMHFFNPVHRMRLVEVVRALDTDDDTLDTIAHVAHRMGKETVIVRESAGFVTSRINALIGNEAFYMLQEGIASAPDIDRALTLGLNHPMGPFALVDLVGLDTRLAVLEHLHRNLGEKYRPCPLLRQYVAAGRLGRKAGRGVYEY